MEYENIHGATFLERPNRFIAHCLVNGREVVAHVKNTGRCGEILVPGTTVYLEHAPSPARKTDWSLISAQKGDLLINIDSQAPNQVVHEALLAGRLLDEDITYLKREAKYGSSRMDFYMETVTGRRIFMEVKGVTLETQGHVLFPDAPTQRGAKHVRELAAAIQEGYEAMLILVVQLSPAAYFTPNHATDPQFALALKEAAAAGVKIHAFDCETTPESLKLNTEIPVRLERES